MPETRDNGERVHIHPRAGAKRRAVLTAPSEDWKLPAGIVTEHSGTKVVQILCHRRDGFFSYAHARDFNEEEFCCNKFDCNKSL